MGYPLTDRYLTSGFDAEIMLPPDEEPQSAHSGGGAPTMIHRLARARYLRCPPIVSVIMRAMKHSPVGIDLVVSAEVAQARNLAVQLDCVARSDAYICRKR